MVQINSQGNLVMPDRFLKIPSTVEHMSYEKDYYTTVKAIIVDENLGCWIDLGAACAEDRSKENCIAVRRLHGGWQVNISKVTNYTWKPTHVHPQLVGKILRLVITDATATSPLPQIQS